MRTVDAVRALLMDAVELYRDRPPVATALRIQLTRLAEPVRIAVAGRSATGKSTLLNALLGETLAPAVLSHLDKHFTWYRHGGEAKVTAVAGGGPAREMAATRAAPGLRLSATGSGPAWPDRVLVDWPSAGLRDRTLIDTPALAGLGAPADPVARRLPAEADAVIYLARHPEPEQLAGLRVTEGSALARLTGVHAILVLARADEVAAGRIDALISARRLARLSRRENAGCAPFQSVIAVSGQLAHAANALDDEDFATLTRLASVSRANLERHLLSTDVFVADGFPITLGRPERRALLGRLGLFGVRLATTLVRTACDTRAKLAAELVRRSGLAELRAAIGTFFVDRGEVLKARSALLLLESVLATERVDGADRLAVRLEQVVASTHDFRELRLIAELSSGRLSLPDEVAAEALRLLGASGTGVAERLGVPGTADADTIWPAVLDALDRWRHAAERLGADESERAAARVVVRSCEGVVAAVG
ncbi:hypothetical protein [Amycolatopsis nigrescens]|uniref:hypothetical protein n=1 Tax=Amycolatopsis nigrescens TaxID=381445 RepID=UPI00037B7A92|nr:hypothetical protein [Amycolatopsis nigrescens]